MSEDLEAVVDSHDDTRDERLEHWRAALEHHGCGDLPQRDASQLPWVTSSNLYYDQSTEALSITPCTKGPHRCRIGFGERQTCPAPAKESRRADTNGLAAA
jgi:hypothetical protein